MTTGSIEAKCSRLRLPGFDVSWAGENAWAEGYCLGSEDGRICFTDFKSVAGLRPLAVAPSGEAINGVAFGGDLMAVSTRSEVVFIRGPDLDPGHVERAVLHGGAHDVVSTPGGRFLAPMGQRGILISGPMDSSAQHATILKPTDEGLYFYKLVGLGTPDRGEVVACACRGKGFAAMSLGNRSSEGFYKLFRPAGIDFVDVDSLATPEYPFAAVALGVDGSFHLIRDLVTDAAATTLHFDLPNERAYRILCAEGHLFLLTNRRLCIFRGLAARFLQDDPLNSPLLHNELDLEAVDLGLARDRLLLVVMPDGVQPIGIDLLLEKAEGRPTGVTPGQPWETVSGSPWKTAEHLDLAHLA